MTHKRRLLVMMGILLMSMVIPFSTARTQETEWKLAESNPSQSEPAFFNEYFAQRVNQLTGGKIKIKIYYGGALGSETECVGMVRMGTLALTRVGCGNVAPTAPEIQAELLPYLFENRRDAARVLQSEAMKPLIEAIAKRGIRLIAWNIEEDRSIFNSNRPINTPADLKGLKIRVPASKLMIETVSAMGAVATAGPWAELYTALKTGVYDGAENGVNVYTYGRFYEVSKYFSHTRHFTNGSPLIMNNKIYQDLPKQIREAIDQAGREAMIYEQGIYDRGRQQWFDALKAAGVKFNDVDREAFKKATRPVFEKFKKEIGEDIVGPIEKAAAAK